MTIKAAKLVIDDFNPRPPCGGRPIPPHGKMPLRTFQSTSSVWRTTFQRLPWLPPVKISIHVLRVEDDPGFYPGRRCSSYFNPRPPCGGRRSRARARTTSRLFQSTSSVWRTTSSFPRPSLFCFRNHFNPRPPCGGRLLLDPVLHFGDPFQSTSSVWRTTHGSV